MITIVNADKASNEICGTGTVLGHAYRLTHSMYGDGMRGNIYIRAEDSLVSLSNPLRARGVSDGDRYVEVDLEITVKEKT